MKLISVFLLLLATKAAFAANSDRYKNFADLAQHEVEGQAYHVDALNRHSRVTIIAIHGGGIEPGSAELAREVARSNFNLYTFVATLPSDNHRLHITSTHFDDPRALSLVTSSMRVISIHGFEEESQDRVCVGGGNVTRRDRMADDLRRSRLGFEIETPCTQFGGDSPQNIVNLGREPGVQLELSTHLRDRLLADPTLMRALATEIRRAL